MKIPAPAKVNLYLSIGKRRPDGYHDLETVFQTVGLYDELTLLPAKKISLRASGLQLPSQFPLGSENIVWRAAEYFFRAFGVTSGLKITLKKNIPVQAGLGGGSSDAAAVLKGCAKLFLKKISPKDDKKLHAIARSLGADVPFFLEGGCALATGVGEKLTKLPYAPFHAVIVKPKIGLSTKEVYGWFDQAAEAGALTPAPQIRKIVRQIRFRKASGKWAGLAFNSFQDVVVRKAPEVGAAISALFGAGCETALLSGSGSAVFGFVKDHAQGKKVSQSLGRSGWRAWAVQSVQR